MAYNADIQSRKRAEQEREMREEKRIVAETQAQLKKEGRARESDKASQRIEMLDYQEYLRSNKEAERRNEAEVERLIQLDMEREQIKLESRREREKLAREKLHEAVMAARLEQVRQREADRLRAAELKSREKEAIDREVERARREQEAEEEEERAREKAVKDDIAQQVELRRQRAHAERQQIAMENKQRAAAESQYRDLISQERNAAAGRSQPSFGRRSVAKSMYGGM
jgi:hypothetical protein